MTSPTISSCCISKLNLEIDLWTMTGMLVFFGIIACLVPIWAMLLKHMETSQAHAQSS